LVSLHLITHRPTPRTSLYRAFFWVLAGFSDSCCCGFSYRSPQHQLDGKFSPRDHFVWSDKGNLLCHIKNSPIKALGSVYPKCTFWDDPGSKTMVVNFRFLIGFLHQCADHASFKRQTPICKLGILDESMTECRIFPPAFQSSLGSFSPSNSSKPPKLEFSLFPFIILLFLPLAIPRSQSQIRFDKIRLIFGKFEQVLWGKIPTARSHRKTIFKPWVYMFDFVECGDTTLGRK